MRLVVLLVVCICRCLFGGRGFTVVWFACSCCLVGGFSGCYCGWCHVVVACCGVVIDLLDDTLFVADFIRCVLWFIYFSCWLARFGLVLVGLVHGFGVGFRLLCLVCRFCLVIQVWV